MTRIERILRRVFQHKEIGWAEIGEKFTRYAIIKSRFFNVYLHQLTAPGWHPDCHDHPWGFVAILLKNGYLERHPKNQKAQASAALVDTRRRPGSILFRPASFAHNVITPYGESWSLIFTGPKSRDWGFKPCNRPLDSTIPYELYIEVNHGA